MEYTQLSPLEIRDLINKYRSDLRKLHFQTLKTQSIIKELEQYVTEAEEALGIEDAKIQELPAAPEVQVTKESDEGADKPSAASKAKATTRKKPGPKPGKTKSKKKTGKRGPGRPPKKKAEKTTKSKGKRGRPAGRLSEWDNLVLQSLKEKKQVLTTSDFAKIAVDDPSIKSGEAQIKVKLNRALHKLANNKGLLAKVDHSGRGFAYALKDWMDSKGKLPKKYERK
ncbi:MAG TPA: hypothetical protein VJ933_02420 [Phaeodactylibacter sp.]|nr:hypothetical protein [Phaeodactylibacter sp.]